MAIYQALGILFPLQVVGTTVVDSSGRVLGIYLTPGLAAAAVTLFYGKAMESEMKASGRRSVT